MGGMTQTCPHFGAHVSDHGLRRGFQAWPPKWIICSTEMSQVNRKPRPRGSKSSTEMGRHAAMSVPILPIPAPPACSQLAMTMLKAMSSASRCFAASSSKDKPAKSSIAATLPGYSSRYLYYRCPTDTAPNR